MNDKFLNLLWLKIKYRIIFKILLIVHNCLKETAPKEIISLLELGDSNRTLHLKQTRTLTKYGDRAFSHMAIKLWNNLPLKICAVEDTESFKKNLKSFLLFYGAIYDWFMTSTITYIVHYEIYYYSFMHGWVMTVLFNQS